MTFTQLTLAPATQLQAVHLVRVFAWEEKSYLLWEIWKAFVSTSDLLFESACNTSKKCKRETYSPCGTDEAVNPDKFFLCHLWASTSDTGLLCRVAWSRCIPSPPSQLQEQGTFALVLLWEKGVQETFVSWDGHTIEINFVPPHKKKLVNC